MAETHIYIYDQIGSGFFSEGVTAKNIAEQINASKDKKIIVHINSPGGSVYEGYAIYNLLSNSGKTIETVVEGMCASISTLIALSASKITMLPLAQWLIHNPFAFIEGDAEDLKKAADDLVKIQNTLVGIYVSKTGKTAEEIQALMNEDRIIDANEAKSLGFVDEVKEYLKAVAFLKPNNSTDNMKDIEKVNERLTFVEAMYAKISAVFKPKNVDVKTKDEKTLVIDPAVEEGATVTQDGAPASDGDITLADGKIITVSAGLITKVTEAPAEGGDASAEEISALKAKIAELESTNAKAKADIAATIIEKTDIQNKFNETQSQMATMRTEIDEIKAMTVGDTKPPRAGAQNFGGSGSGSVWDEVAKQAKSK
jgi:ATP-dependent Clp endopeptidase proteolytic subunit ClpP